MTLTTPPVPETVINVHRMPTMTPVGAFTTGIPAVRISTRPLSTRYVLAGIKTVFRPLHTRSVGYSTASLMHMDAQGTVTVYRTLAVNGTEDPISASPVDLQPVFMSPPSQQFGPLDSAGNPTGLVPIQSCMVDRFLIQLYHDRMLSASVTRLTEPRLIPGRPEARPSQVISRTQIYRANPAPAGNDSSHDIDPWQACIYVAHGGVLRVCDFVDHSL